MLALQVGAHFIALKQSYTTSLASKLETKAKLCYTEVNSSFPFVGLCYLVHAVAEAHLGEKPASKPALVLYVASVSLQPINPIMIARDGKGSGAVILV